MAYFLWAFLPTVWIVAAFHDLTEFRIPNWACGLLLCGYPVAAIYFESSQVEIIQSLLLAAGVLLVSFGLFALNTFGAGDAKLLGVSALWIGLPGFPVYILKVAVVGGVVALLLVGFRALPAFPIFFRVDWVARLYEEQKKMPYGLAIVGGGVWSITQTQFYMFF